MDIKYRDNKAIVCLKKGESVEIKVDCKKINNGCLLETITNYSSSETKAKGETITVKCLEEGEIDF